MKSEPDEKYVLVSRENKHKNLESTVDFQWFQTDYIDSDQTIADVNNLGADRIVWLSAPFFRDFFVEQSAETVNSVITTGMRFPLEVAKGVIPAMITKRFGRFLFIGSVLANLGDKGSLLYSTMKYAQMGLSRGIAMEYGKFNITSNVLSLGPLEKGLASDLPDARKTEYLSRSARGNLITTEEVAFNIHALLKGQGISGQEIRLDAGFR